MAPSFWPHAVLPGLLAENDEVYLAGVFPSSMEAGSNQQGSSKSRSGYLSISWSSLPFCNYNVNRSPLKSAESNDALGAHPVCRESTLEQVSEDRMLRAAI